MRDADAYKGKIDFAIISIREDEYSAVLERFPTEDLCVGNNRLYSISTVELAESERYVIACAPSIEQGGGHAQDVARDMIEDLDPGLILLVGIAGAVPDTEFTLGDVVIAKRVHDFSVGAAIEGKGLQLLDQGGPMHKLVQNLLAQLPALKKLLGNWNAPEKIGIDRPHVDPATAEIYGDTEWKTKVIKSLRAQFGSGAGTRAPIVTARSIASGNVLMKDTAVLGKWLDHARELAAIEMELNGVYIAARRLGHDYPILAIRGISDIVGLQRDPIWTRYACQSAASCAHAFIAAQLLPPREHASNDVRRDIEPDPAQFEQFCRTLRERRVGRGENWGGEISSAFTYPYKGTPKIFLGSGALVVHFVPASAVVAPPLPVDLSKLLACPDLLAGIQSWTKPYETFRGYTYNDYPRHRHRRNADGLLLWSSKEKESEDEYAGYYIQFNLDGIVEAADHCIMRQVLHSKILPGTALERAVASLVPAVLDSYRELGVEGPVWIAVSILDRLDYVTISYDEQVSRGPANIGRNYGLFLPPVIVDLEETTSQVMRKLVGVFHSLAHAGGWEKSPNHAV